MYKWHRTLGIITLIPVIFWTLSGIMHPFMSHFFKPQIANEKLDLRPIDQTKLHFSIQEILKNNNVANFKNFRIVQFDNVIFYQIKTTDDKFVYYNTVDGKLLENGDIKYAQWLSRYFLDDQKSSIKSIVLVTEFDKQYKYVNRYLPVYKLTFDRPDTMEIYVETSSSRLATYNPTSRQFFIWFFDVFHNWSFIDAIINNVLRIILMILLLSIITFSAVSGIVIYGFLWKQFKKTDSLNPKKGLRKYHRQIGIWISLFTILFAFSGAYHATTKWTPNTLSKMVYEPVFTANEIILPNNKLDLDWSKLANISVIKLKKDFYYQCQFIDSVEEKQQIKTQFINTTSGIVNDKTQLEYAQFLVNKFAKMQTNCTTSCCDVDEPETNKSLGKLVETKVLYDFESREYGFVNKRLPVVKLAYDTPEKTTYYIEAATSRLAAVITNSDRLEGYSFAFLHKFLFMDWAGKTIRDLATIIAALSMFVVSVLGLILFLKKK